MLMIVKMTLYEIYHEIDRLKKARDLNALIATSFLAEGDENNAKHFAEKYKRNEKRIEYLASISVEFEGEVEEA